MMMT